MSANGVRGKRGFTNGSGKGFTNGTGKGFTNGSGKGMTNGLGKGFVNGSGRGVTNGSMNGLTNGAGRGMTNGVGSGLTNGAGRGMTNGSGRGTPGGFTNGSAGFTNGMGGRLNDQGSVHPKRLSAILIVILVMLVPISLALLATPQGVPGKLVTIDGKFKDWNKMNEYLDASMCGDAPLDISSFSIAFDESDFYFRFNVQGALLSRATVDRYFAFLDSDANAATGYSFGGIGADYAVEAFGSSAGWGVQTAKFAGADQSNWSAFATIGGGHAESVGTEAEVQGVLDAKLAVGDVRVRMATMSGSDIADVCAPTVDGVHGALVVRQVALESAGIVSSTSLMTLTLTATGGDVAYSGITVAATSVAVSQPVGSSVADSGSATIPVIATSAPANATFVKAAVSSVAMTTGTCAILGRGLAAYYAEAPTTIAIDGAFADWNGVAKTSDTVGDVSNSNIDIIDEAAATQAASLFAYVKFGGTPMAGMAIPSTRTISSGGSGGAGGEVSALPKVAGEDVCRIYIDSVAGGSAIGGIQADYVIELRGKDGHLTSKDVCTYPARNILGRVLAETGAGAIETSVPLMQIGSPAGTMLMYVETTDWENAKDCAGPVQTSHALRTRSNNHVGANIFGGAVVFNSASTSYISSAYDPANGKVVMAYSDSGMFGLGTVVIGTVSGTGISFGTPVRFSSAEASDVSVAYTTNGKVVIAYSDVSDSGYGIAIVGTVSGTSITMGLPSVFEPTWTTEISAIYDSAHGKVVITYGDFGGSDYGNAVVGTISETNISFGTPSVFVSAALYYSSLTYDSTNGKVVVAYSDWVGSRFGRAIVGTVSGTSISFGTPAVFESAVTEYISATYCSSQGKVVIAYSDTWNSLRGTAVVGTVSGTSISFGTPAVFESGATAEVSITYDSIKGKVVIAYSDTGNLGYGTAAVGTVTGTSISYGVPEVFESAAISYTSATYDSSNGKVVIAYQDNGNSDYGTAIVMEVPEYSATILPIVFGVIPFAVFRARKRRRE